MSQKTKRVLLIGGSGQVGQALRAEPLPENWVFAAPPRAECDLTDHAQVQASINNFKPDIIINTASMTNVDACEKDSDSAVAANFEGPANLAAQCCHRDIPLIHLSTDYVFDGADGSRPYTPDDPMNPLCHYANTKMMGEESIRHEMAWHVILRVASVYSTYGTNIFSKLLTAIETKDELRMVTDQVGSPTYAPDIAKALIRIVDAVMGGKFDAYGTFHFAGDTPMTRYQFAQDIMQAYAPHIQRLPKLFTAVSSDFPGFATRPAYSVLDSSKLERVYGIPASSWKKGLAEAIAMHVAARDARNADQAQSA
ncbi:MAG: dTDP-4-dehydrorhamnose reductase [Alphaproteobacteria bacterium]|nr:dTDP-4-dehydrorhamnose reductase [Alphaproteobacteria bacterium]MBV8549104.1 dTDP-4-dehydrorhamnose reductase [Alphaproteobacteria bacterium]